MDKENRELINKGLILLQSYLKGRVISRISLGFIGGGISILGFSNVFPYIAILIKPELSEKIELENNILTFLGVTMIVIGALIPLFLRIFNHYRNLYINDLKRINQIYKLSDFDTFSYQMNRIGNNTSILDYEIDQIEELFYLIQSTDFFFNDKKTNELVKKLGNELSNFNSEMSLRVSPSNGNPHIYDIPRNHPTFNQTATEILADCIRLTESYREMKERFDILNNKKFMRFFK